MKTHGLLLIIVIATMVLCKTAMAWDYDRDDEAAKSIFPSFSRDIAPRIIKEHTPGTQEYQLKRIADGIEKIERDLNRQ